MAEPLDPDEICQVCSATRENHGDKHHAFSRDGSLVPIAPGTAARRSPPGTKTPGLVEAQTTGLILRMIERLTQKGLLDGEDLTMIFGGSNAPVAGGPAHNRAREGGEPPSPGRGSGAHPTE